LRGAPRIASGVVFALSVKAATLAGFLSDRRVEPVISSSDGAASTPSGTVSSTVRDLQPAAAWILADAVDLEGYGSGSGRDQLAA